MNREEKRREGKCTEEVETLQQMNREEKRREEKVNVLRK